MEKINLKTEIVFIGKYRIKYRWPALKNAFKVLWKAIIGYKQTIISYEEQKGE